MPQDINDNLNQQQQAQQDPETAARLRDEANVQSAQRLYAWGYHNLRRFDTTGDDKLNFGEMDLGVRTSRDQMDQTMLQEMQAKFQHLRGGKPVGIDELYKDVQAQEKVRDDHERTRQAWAAEKQARETSQDLMRPLFATPNGHPNNSLFKVIDGLDGDVDNEISKKDLDRYLNEYGRRSKYGDVGSGFFSQENVQYVQFLKDNWDRSDVVRLRGQWKDSDGDLHANGKMTFKSLNAAAGFNQGSDLWAPFVDPNMNSMPRRISAEAEPRQDEPQPRDRQAEGPKPLTPIGYQAGEQESLPTVSDAEHSQRVGYRRDASQRANELLGWAKGGGFNRYDTTGDERLNFGELDLGVRTNNNQAEIDKLQDIQNNYNRLKDQNSDIFGHKDSISYGDLEKDVRVKAEKAHEAELEARSRALMKPLLATENGHPNMSLFKVIDGLDGDNDNSITKGDLKKYMDTYNRRARVGDVGSGHFSQQSRDYVQYLMNNWDNEDVARLRDGQQNTYVSEERLRSAAGMSKNADLYGAFVAQPKQEVRRASTKPQDIVQQTSLNTADGSTGSPSFLEGGSAAQAQPEPRVRQPEPEVVKQTQAQPEPRVRQPEPEAVVKQTQAQPEPRVRQPEPEAVVQQTQAQPEAIQAEVQPKPAEAVSMAPKNIEGQLAAARNIDSTKYKDLSSEQAEAQMKADFEAQIKEIYGSSAKYTVKAGQGFDRIARDWMRRASGQQQQPEAGRDGVVAFSDQIAKLNGWNSRLDMSKMLQPEQVIRVRDDNWIKEAVAMEMKLYEMRQAAARDKAMLETP